jgi:hypothetical protein
MANRLKIVTMIRKGFIIMAAFFALQKKSDQIQKVWIWVALRNPKIRFLQGI